MLTITENAVKKINAFIQAEDTLKGKSLRLRLTPSGCAGYEYKIGFEEKAPDDKILPQSGFDVIVDPKTLPLIGSATIDYAEDETSSGFRIQNPIEKSSCSCGKSKQF